MILPLVVLERMRQGIPIAARIRPSDPNHVAWITVFPMSRFEPYHGLIDKNLKYRVWRVEIAESDHHLFKDDDPGENIYNINESQYVADEESVEAILSQWLDDFSELKLLTFVDFPL